MKCKVIRGTGYGIGGPVVRCAAFGLPNWKPAWLIKRSRFNDDLAACDNLPHSRHLATGLTMLAIKTRIGSRRAAAPYFGMSNSSDISLLTRWIADCGGDLLGYLVRRLRCRETAADLCQETYLRLYTGPATECAEHLHARAFRIATHLTIDHQRKQSARLEWQAWQPDTVATAPSPEVILIDRQRLRAVRRALDALPPECRTALVLNRLHGRSHAEIASHMRIAPRTVAKYLAQALRACRHLVDND